MFDFIKNIISPPVDLGEEQDLALKAEARARRLSGLPERPASAPDDLKAVLKSTCLLLDRLVDHDRARRNEKGDEPSTHGEAQPCVEAKRAEPVPAQEPSGKREPSPTAQELIKLRDWVLIAKDGDPSSVAQIMGGLYRKLGGVLEKEGVTALEGGGPFDDERQQVIETRETDDPRQHNQVCGTVRPGYLFGGELIRPQEVIIHTCPSGSLPNLGSAPFKDGV